MKKFTSLGFYHAWLDSVTSRKEHLLEIWRNAKVYTGYIIGDEDSVIREVASSLNLECYTRNYYSLDAILYQPEDKTPRKDPNSYWFRDIRVAFEHENNFKSGLYKEVSHLMITNCDLKVLVTYPNGDTENELKYLHDVISGSRQSNSISDGESFLIIFGYENGFEWEGYIYKLANWKKISSVT